MTTSQRLVEAELDRAIASTQDTREAAMCSPVVESIAGEFSWRFADAIAAAVLVGLVAGVIFGGV